MTHALDVLAPESQVPLPWILGLHLLSAHAHPGYDTVTPGLFVRSPGGITAGVLRNSVGRPGVYLGQTFETADGRFALTLGAITGYRTHCEGRRVPWHGGTNVLEFCDDSNKPKPLVAASVAIPEMRFADFTPRLSFCGKALTLSIERSL